MIQPNQTQVSRWILDEELVIASSEIKKCVGWGCGWRDRFHGLIILILSVLSPMVAYLMSRIVGHQTML